MVRLVDECGETGKEEEENIRFALNICVAIVIYSLPVAASLRKCVNDHFRQYSCRYNKPVKITTRFYEDSQHQYR